ncbi:MAG: SDR family NAD(P)-dependent oxidoreductase [bacterium]|nr:SDR family NAD(P)-dependent oxidoreductase [bacterium]
MNILVTGAAGFIGSHVCERLIAEGNVVVGLDNFDPFYSRAIKEAHVLLIKKVGAIFFEGDVRNRALVRKLLAEYKITHVIHLAALAGVRPSVAHAEDYIDVNIRGTQIVLEEATRGKVEHIVMSGSASVYAGTETPFREDTPAISPASPYAASKRAAELIASAHHHLYGTPITSLRFFSVYGPRVRPDLAIPLFVNNINSEKPIILFGDGSSRRDYTYILDIIDGIILALIKPYGFEIVNLGCGEPISLSLMVEEIESALRKKAIIEYRETNNADAPITHADISKAKKLYNFSPKISFSVGIRKYIDSRA